ncbi:PEP-CTERM sorting domain-containing protein [Novipirellula sp.]|uniref:PEP-CTERM sorting domain-containing protein n=1 Tax=Novipirellula sp. TaxID=2795430 RepID=UPI00356187E2
MRLLLITAALGAASLLVTPAAQAGIVFDKAVNFNLSAVDAALTNIDGVNGVNFGDISFGSATGRVAVNTTDNGDGSFGVGDGIKVVGHALIDKVSLEGGGSRDPLDLGQAKSFQLTGVLRDLAGVVSVDGFGLFNHLTSGFLDLYLDVSTPDDFTVGDIANSVDGVLVATFELIEGKTRLFGGPTTLSSFDFKLVDQFGSGTVGDLTDDFFQLAGGYDPLVNNSLLATQVISTDTRTSNTLTNISGSHTVDIGSGFTPVPATPTNGDFYANVDGSGGFGVIPEPASIAIFGLMGAAGFAGRRRRKKTA